MGIRPLTKDEESRFARRLDSILENREIVTAVLAGNDGQQLAAPSSSSHEVGTTHIADACAKIVAVGRQLAGQSARPARGVTVCDLAGSPMVVVPMGPALLIILGCQGANMGMVAGTARDAARQLVDDLKTVVETKAPAPRARSQPEEPQQQAVDEVQKADEEYQGFVFDADGFLARVLGDLEKRDDPDLLGEEV